MKLRYIALLLSLLPLLAIPVSAHPGKTDSSGGHTNHSTGDYHYHHGYEAHEHYDKDGDGDLDCPYDFDDKTDHSSNKSESSNPSNNAHPNSTEASKNTSFFIPKNFFWSFLLACIFCFFALVFVRKMEIHFCSGKSYSAFLVVMDIEIVLLALFASRFFMPGVGFEASLMAEVKIWNILGAAFYLGVVMWIFWFFYSFLVLLAFSNSEDSAKATDKISLNITVFTIIAYLYFLVSSMCGFISADPLYSWLR